MTPRMPTHERRRCAGFVLALALALIAPLNAGAQKTAKLPRIGFLVLGYDGRPPQLFGPALQALGYVNGKNVIIESRYAEGRPERLPELAAELVRMKVDVLVAITNVSAFAAKNATKTIPIVVYAAHGGVETGLFASLARPGGNLTGVESLAPELDAKRVELMKEIVPAISQLAILVNPADQGSPIHLKYARAAAQAMNISVSPLEVKRPEEVERALAALDARPHGGLLIFTDDVTHAMREQVLAHAQARRLPTICEFEYYVDAGCLVSYGPLIEEFVQRNALQIDKILKGANPADLPVEQMTRFELVVNQKTARAIGVTIPKPVLLRADKVIE